MKKIFTLFLSVLFWLFAAQAQKPQLPKVKDDPHARVEFEFNKIKSPLTGKVPDNIRERELKYVRSSASGLLDYSKADETTWANRGPWNVGGRTRALAVDLSDNNVIFAAGVSGGLWKSADKGQSWVKVSLPDIDHAVAVTCIAQDPSNNNIWYYGTGEYLGNSASEYGASYRGAGLFRSTDGGNTWTQVYSSGTVEQFDSFMDFIWDIKVNPQNGDVYVATYDKIFRSTDGINYSSVLSGSSSDYNFASYTDVEVTTDGTIYAALSQDGTNHGLFKSTDGTNWTDITPSNFPTDFNRIVIGASPSNPDIVYFLGHRDATDANGRDLHLLWKYDNSTGSWTDLSSNIPMPTTKAGYFDSQGGYDLVIKVKPDDPNVFFIGGTNLYRTTDGGQNFDHVGGYTASGTSYALYTNHHPDQHSLAFDPANSSVLYSGHDGGISVTNDCLDATENTAGETIDWTSLNNGYLTTQAYSVAIEQSATLKDWIVAGFQDNGSWLTVSTSPTVKWYNEFSGDGGFCALAKYTDGYVEMFESQKGSIYAYFYDNTGAYQSWARIYPDLTDPLFITPYTLDPNNADIMYILDGASFWRHTSITNVPRSTDDNAPAGWEQFSKDLAGEWFSTLAVSKTPANILFLGTSNGEVYKVVNANTGTPVFTEITGGSLPAGSYVSSIAVDPDDANKILVSVPNYEVPSIFYTEDGGNTWTDVSGNLEENPDGSGSGPSVRSVAILKGADGSVHYFAGTSTGLYSTQSISANTTWTQEGVSTIGNVLVDMVVARQADGKVFVATHGNGIYYNSSDIVTATGENLQTNSFDVYPNPANGIFNIELPGESGKLIIRNTLAQVVYTGNLPGGKTQIDISMLPEGNYFAQFYTDNGKIYQAKLIIKK